MSLRYDAKQFRTHETGLGYDASYTGHSCHTDSDPFEAPSDDSDSSAAPPRRCRASQKSSRSRHNKLRTLNRWTTEEHDKLAYLVQKWGSEKNWAKVAEEMPGRTGKQCRERWLNHMKPGIVKGNWSTEEEFLLAQCHALVGSHWSKMTKRLPGRTENSIKNFWNATLRSKAPNKKRGMLWTYMQLHDPKSEDNTNALMATVNRLHETRELPPQLLAQLDAQLLDNRTWKAIHKAEKEYLESVGGELHHLALPHPMMGGMAAPMHGYGAGAGTTGPSPLAAALPHHHHHGYMGHTLMPDGSYAPPNGVNMTGGMDGNQYVLSEVPGAVSGGIPGVPMGLDHYMLTAQDPLLSCIPDTLDQDSYRVLTSGVPQHNTYQHSCPATGNSDTAQAGPDGLDNLSACAHADLKVEPLPSDGLVGHYDPILQQNQQQADISCSMPAAAPIEQPTSVGLLSMPATSSTMLQCVDPTAIADESCVVRPESGSHSQTGGLFEPLPRALILDEQQQQQQGLYGLPQMQQVGSHGPAAGHNTSMQFSNKPAGGHGPHCSCGPCSNSRRLHGLHSPGARRTARQNSKTGSRFQQPMPSSMLSTGGDGSRVAGLPACKVQQQGYVADHHHAAAAADMYAGVGCGPNMQHSAHGEMQVMPDYSSAGSGQYGDCAADDIDHPCSVGGQVQCIEIKQEDVPLDYQQEAAQRQALAEWSAAAGDLGHQAMDGPAALLDAAQPPAMHTSLASDGSEQVMVASHHGSSDGLYWHGSQAHTHMDTQHYHQQQQQDASMPHPEVLPQQQQHASSSQALDAAEAIHQHHKNLVLTDLTVPRFPSDALTGLILSPLGLLSPLSGLMMPTSTRPFRLPSFGQITMMRPSINGGEWDWEALLSSDISHNARNVPAASAAAGAAANGTLNPNVQHGDGVAAAAAAGAKVGAKRPRVSFSSMDDDASLLIDMQPAKVLRNNECSMTSAANAGGLFVRQFIKHC